MSGPGDSSCGSDNEIDTSNLRTRSGLSQPSADLLAGTPSGPNKSRSTEPLSGLLVCLDDESADLISPKHNIQSSSSLLQNLSTQRQLSGPGLSNRELEDEGDLQQASTATLATADTDSLSTDSYDEPWDVRHGRVIQELTSTRLIDPSSVFPSHLAYPTNFAGEPPAHLKGHHPASSFSNNGFSEHSMHHHPISAQYSPHASGHPRTNTTSGAGRLRRTSGGGSAAPGQQGGGNASSRSHSAETNRQTSREGGHHHFQFSGTSMEDAGDVGEEEEVDSPVGREVWEPIDGSLSLEEQCWYHPGASRATAEDILTEYKAGSYLVRRSETNTNGFSLTIKHNRGYLHMKISRNIRGQFILGQYSQPYLSIPAMICHYSKNLLPIKGADSMTLRFPVGRSNRAL